MVAEVESMKRAAGEWAVDQVQDGMVVGLGTGSTAAYAIDALGRAVDAGLTMTGVPTSQAARQRALDAGIPVADLDAVEGVDMAIDGADQVADGELLKGGGGAHTRERLVDAIASTFIVVVDEGKLVDRLDVPVPVEVLPMATGTVADAIAALGGDPTLRLADRIDGPAYTERGNPLIDADFGRIGDPTALAAALSAIPGIVDHGIFVDEADVIAVGIPDGVRTVRP